MSATLENAETYFAPTNHIYAATWNKFPVDQRTAAIAQAKRTLNRACAVDDVETDLDEETGMNIEYAIYEQALFSLMNVPLWNADETFAIPTATAPDEDSNARKPDRDLIAPEARRWLTTDYGISLSRG